MKIRVAIDAGHGGTDHGCHGGGLIESKLTIDLARLVVLRLAQGESVEPYLLRIDDSQIDLSDRAGIASRAGCDAVVSLHFDSATADRNWTAVYWHRGDKAGHAMARSIKLAVEAAGRRCRAYCTDHMTDNKPSFPRALALTREYRQAGLPTCLVECAFLSNAADCRWIEDNGLDVLASAISAGCEAWAGKDRR